MSLPESRIVAAGETPYAHEREALAHLVSVLPGSDPFHVWTLVDLLEPGSGRLYEVDAIVLGYSALYLVEIKSGPGVYTGDQHDWYRADPPGARPHYLENPYRLTNHKAKVLASRLKLAGSRVPRVEALVFLSHPDARVELAPEGRIGVVDRRTLQRALTNHEFPGADAGWQHRKIDRTTTSAVLAGMRAIGVRPRKGRLHVGAYELGTILGEGPGHQDRVATHRDLRFERRARVYLVPEQTSVERRQQLRRAAEREVALLRDVREHPGILRFLDYVPDAPLGPTVLFDELDDAVPLDAFLRRRPELTFAQRVSILEQVGRALAHCHRRGVVHGSIGPHAVLARERASAPEGVDVRLFGFELGSSSGVEGTSHLTALAGDAVGAYLAPELSTDPDSRSPAADLFGLAALAHFVLTGRAPAENHADLLVRLTADRCLDPQRARDDLPKGVVDLVKEFTRWNPAERAQLVERPEDPAALVDDVEGWTDELVRLARIAREGPAAHVDPLEAQPESTLVATSPSGEVFEVREVLGHGATARVLGVVRERDGRELALKVPLSPEAGARFADEAAVLRELHADAPSQHVVRLEAEVTIGGRPCLLLSVAGSETLHKHLARLGTLSLEETGHYGEELLLALESLEERRVQHRDIKPANLGVGARGKGKRHLTLFDFSLSRFEASQTRVGTAAYRDPHLEARGAWDEAADRWSAAVVLHEMLAGARPATSGPMHDPEARVIVRSAAFDPALRTSLTAFFEQAFARDAAARFASAAEMRRAWLRALDAAPRPSRPAAEAEVDDEVRVDEETLRAIRAESPIFALPLSPRAKNALDRAGVVRAEQLLSLPENRLSAIRGIGSVVAREILELRRKWSDHLAQPLHAGPLFFPGYLGEDLPVLEAYTEGLRDKLRDAGFSTLAQIASSPASLVSAFAKRAGVPEGALKGVLMAHHQRAADRDDPRTVEAWLDALLPATQKKSDLRQLYGLVGPFEGRVDVRANELAAARGITTAAVYVEIGKERRRWARHAHLDRLRGLCVDVTERAWGALPLGRAAEQLLAALPHDTTAAPAVRRARAAALFRVIAEVEKSAAEADPSHEPELRVIRLRDAVWVLTSHALVKTLGELGDAADRLAQRPVPAAPAEARELLAPIVQATSLAGLSDERLLELAALASSSASCSARLEIVPRGLPAERALALCAPLLRTGLEPAAVRGLVAARYPDAVALPDRPALDALLTPFGLHFDGDSGQYRRQGEGSASTSLGTHLASSTSAPLPGARLRARSARPSPTEVELGETDEALRRAVELRALRVLAAPSHEASDAARAVAQVTGARVVALDRLLVDAMKGLIREKKVDPRVVHQADRERDPRSPSWARLLQLARAAAERVRAALLPHDEPLVLVQPGLVARYELTELLAAVLEAGRQPELPALFFLVPGHDVPGVPTIEGTLPLPGVLGSQVIRLSTPWVRGKLDPEAA